MDADDVLIRLGTALAIGLLVGVERGWRSREEGEGERAAGLRTFALVGLSGGVWGLLAKSVGPVPLAVAFFAVAAALTLFRWRETERDGTLGATTLVAAFLTFALGALAVLGDLVAAVAAGVATAGLLAAKDWLHAGLRILTWPELRSALILLAMSFVVLPVLPDRGFGPYEALNPRSLWLMTIVIAGVSFIGYVAVRVVGERYGSLITGIVGGLVSSTATTLTLARRTKAGESWRPELAGSLAASAVMFARVALVVGLFGASLLPRLAAPLAAAALVTIAIGLYFGRPWQPAESGGAALEKSAAYRNPFDLTQVLAFGAILAVVVFLTRALTDLFGSGGSIALAAIAGLGDVDAVTLSMTGAARTSVGPQIASIAILVAVATNSAAKAVLAFLAGGSHFGTAYAGATLAAIGAGAVATALSWS